MLRPFRQVDVFTHQPYRGNPVAVVHDADGIDDDALLRFAQWTNLSETTFLLPPTTAEADYRVRIFTLAAELPFAGHPTLGTCHAWLEAGGAPRDPGVIVQECSAGLIRVRRSADGGLAFAAPPLIRDGPVEEVVVDHIADVLCIPRAAIVASQWADNGPGWVAVLLSSAAEVLALQPGFVDLDLGVAGPYPDGSAAAFEVRA
ncbi:MAG: PhzF family phenazine biosynthesis protein, partial [Candidatus Limnocylindrales bacterium]